MNKEQSDSTKEAPSSPIRELESQRFKHATLRQVLDSIDSGDLESLYNWLEENIIMGTDKAQFQLRTEDGIESATIKQFDPETKKWVEYYTTDKSEIERLKAIRDGQAIKIQAF